MKRRTLLKAGIGAGFGGILLPGVALAQYPKNAFLAKETPEALREIFGTADIGDGDRIEIEAPPIAIDAKMVPVRIRSGYDNTESISLIVSGNESPFTAHFKLYDSQNFVSTRIRMSDTGELLVVVKADGVLHTGRRMVRVGRNECRA